MADARGPLDILRETWKASKRSDESVVSYVLTVQQKLAKMSELVSENWPYLIKAKVTPVTYEIDMSDRKKWQRIFYVNMLKGWNTPTTMCLAAKETEEGEEIQLWKDDIGEPKINERLTPKQRGQLNVLRAEFTDVMSDLPGKAELVEHRIETGDAKPVRLPPYRLPHAYRDIVKKELEEMEKYGIIEKSTSDWFSLIVLAKKKDGTLRFCIDFRRLNSVSKADAYPMPRADDLLNQVGQARFISTLDLTKGYWQVPMEKTARSKTTFRTSFGLYQFCRMPFGLQGAPSTRVLQKLREAGLTVKQKCQLAMSHCSYLGHVVGEGLVQPELSKVDAVKQFQVPTTKSAVRTFLGLTGYYRKTEHRSLEWLDRLKENNSRLTRWSLALQPYQYSVQYRTSQKNGNADALSQYMVEATNASGEGLGAVLSQVVDGHECVVSYASRVLSRIHIFRPYLYGKRFTLRTDHNCLKWLHNFKEPEGQVARWLEVLAEFNDEVVHHPGHLGVRKTVEKIQHWFYWPGQRKDVEMWCVPSYRSGKNFESALIKEICQLLGVKKTRTTHHPQSDGLMERFNRTVLDMLSMAVQQDEHGWDLLLPPVMLAYRTSVQETTGITPFSLMFEREPCLPEDIMFGIPAEE
eukprot:Em0018g542a